MNLLLDTHAFVWWYEDSKRLGKTARSALSKPGNSVWLSAASAWEIAIKSGAGRFLLKKPADEIIARLVEDGLQTLPISIQHALAVRNLPLHHADPFDRILIAQAQCEDMTLVTADAVFDAYEIRALDASE